MLRRILAMSLVPLATVAVSNCGSSSSGTTKTTGNGSVFALVGDAPFCDVLAFRAAITDLFITEVAGSTVGPHILNPLTSFIHVDFNQLRGFSTILGIDSSVPAGTYVQGKLKLSEQELVVFDPTQNPPIRVVGTTLTTGNKPITVDINPPLVVPPPINGRNQVAALKIDLDLAHSVEVDARGQITGTINPILLMTPVPSDPATGFGEMDDVIGYIRQVDTSSSNPNFIGDFSLQLLSGSGPSILTSLTSSTQLCAPATVSNQICSPVPLNQLPTDSVVEVDGNLDAQGNFVASTVQIENQASVAQNKLGFIGYVLPTGTDASGRFTVTKDPNGDVTQFNFFLAEEEPDPGLASDVPPDSVVVVNVPSTAIYQSSSPSTNFAHLDFGPTAIAVGQELVVHGAFTKPPSSVTATGTLAPTTVAADSIYLKPQTHEGAFVQLLAQGSDDRTGGFILKPCASLFAGPGAPPAPIYVFTSPLTSFLNVVGLSRLTPQASLLVKGLLFYEAQPVAVNGVTTPPGSYVLLARQVHQLP